jgi:hypothetical protein
LKYKKLASIVASTVISSAFCAALFIPSADANSKSPKIHQKAVEKSVADQAVTSSSASTSSIPERALKYAINGYRWAVKHHEVSNPTVLTVVNFNEPSYKKRLWVIDLKNDRVLMHMHVAQGKNSGAVYAKHFSNQPGSLESSPGIFTTAGVYDGEHGESLRVKGLEHGINNNVYSRAVVIHPAWYVTPSFIKQNGYAGRSWGCFAVDPAKADRFIHTIRGGSVLFAYAAPEEHDPRVNHELSAKGQALYNAIEGQTTSHWFL